MATRPAQGSGPPAGRAAGAPVRQGANGPNTISGNLIQRRVLRDGVYDAVLEMLLDGQISPGQSLSIEGLARDLGVSPTPVREALARLEHTGLVTRAALKGYRVAAPLTPERTSELIDARAVVEVAAIRRAVPVNPAVLAELEDVSARHRTAAARVRKMVNRDPGRLDWATLRKYYTVDWEFHLVLLRNCGNPYLLEMAEDLSPHVHRLRQSMNHGAIDVEQAVAEHAVILDAVRAGEPDDAAAAMAAHIAAVRLRAVADG